VLEWQLKNASKLKHLETLKKRKEAGEHIPFLDNEPELHPLHYWIWEGFGALARQRLHGHEQFPQPIQISEIAAYADYVGIVDEIDREDFMRCVCAMDEITLTYAQKEVERGKKKQEREAKRKSPSSGRRRR
jgi:hypothetical protein